MPTFATRCLRLALVNGALARTILASAFLLPTISSTAFSAGTSWMAFLSRPRRRLRRRPRLSRLAPLTLPHSLSTAPGAARSQVCTVGKWPPARPAGPTRRQTGAVELAGEVMASCIPTIAGRPALPRGRMDVRPSPQALCLSRPRRRRRKLSHGGPARQQAARRARTTSSALTIICLALRLVPARPLWAAAARARRATARAMHTPAATRASLPRARLAALTTCHSLPTSPEAVGNQAPVRPATPTRPRTDAAPPALLGLLPMPTIAGRTALTITRLDVRVALALWSRRRRRRLRPRRLRR